MKLLVKNRPEFITFLRDNESWLMDRILYYAKVYDYAKYTSTLIEAWRISIVGLTDSLDLMMQASPEIPQMGPDETFEHDPASAFGLKEAVLHRSRGVSLAMFFSLFKYYRQSYIDLLHEHESRIESLLYYEGYCHRFFDRVEAAYIIEWAGRSAEDQIHELAAKNRELANEKNRYLTLFDSMDTAAIIINLDYNIENFNLRAGELFFDDDKAGTFYYNPRETSINDIIPYETLSNDDVIEWHYKAMDFMISRKSLHDVSGKNEGEILLFNDVTQLKQNEKIMLSQSRHAAIGEMIGMIAHQWRQPLSIISMGVNNILFDIELETLESESLKTLSYEILQQTDHLSKTIDDFGNFFNPVSEKKQLCIYDVLMDTTNIIGTALANQSIALHVNNATEMKVEVYRRELIQVLLSLLSNAKEAILQSASKQRRIDVEIFNDEHNVICQVCDSGGGIDPKIMDKIFDPYFSTKKVLNGTGLGLYMSKVIVENHFLGTIEVKNSEYGACFSIKIPISN